MEIPLNDIGRPGVVQLAYFVPWQRIGENCTKGFQKKAGTERNTMETR